MEIRFLFIVALVGLAYGSRMFSVPLILTWHTAMYDCAEQGTEAGCLDGGQNFCIWKNNTCYFHDYLSINCSDFHNSSKLCVSQQNERCFYRFTTDRCLHHSGFSSSETGIFAAASVSGGMVSFLVEKLIGDDVSGMIITAIIELISSVIFTIAVETNEYSLWILTQILGSVVTFYCVSVAPDILRRTGRLTQKACGKLLRILGVSIGISAFIYAMLFYFMTPRPFYKENPKFRQSLHLYGLGFYLTAVGVLMIAFIMKYPQWLDDNCPNNCCWLSSSQEEEEEEEETQLGGNDNSSEVCSSPSPPIEGKLGDQDQDSAQAVTSSPKQKQDNNASSPSTSNPLTFPKRTRTTTSSSIHSTTSSNRSQKKRLKKEQEIRRFSQMFPQPIPELTPHLALLYQPDDSDKEDVDEDNDDENSSQEGGDEMKENDNNNDNNTTTFDTIPTVMSPLDLPSPIPFTNNDDNDEQQKEEVQESATTKLQKTEISPNSNASRRNKQSPSSPARSETKSVTIVASPVEIIEDDENEENDGNNSNDDENQQNNNNLQVEANCSAAAEPSTKTKVLVYIAAVAVSFAKQTSGIGAVGSFLPLIMSDVSEDNLLSQLLFACSLPAGALLSFTIITRFLPVDATQTFVGAAALCCIAALFLAISLYPGILSPEVAPGVAVFGVIFFSISFGAGPSVFYVASLAELFTQIPTMKDHLAFGISVSNSVNSGLQTLLTLVFPIFVASVSDDPRISRSLAFFCFFGAGSFFLIVLIILLYFVKTLKENE